MRKLAMDPGAEALSLNEFFARARREVDVRDPTSLLELAEPLYRLARDTQLLAKFVNHDLAHWASTGHLHFYSPQSCQLMSDGPLLVRVNLWPTLPADPRRRAILSQVLSYYDYHDHNFSFITANYFGPGYETEVFGYDASRMLGVPGEDVELEPLGTHVLDDSCVLYFEQSADVHRQLPPPSPSASINLMLTSPQSSLVNQHYFDPDAGRVTGYVESHASKRVNALTFAARVGDAQTQALLEQLVLVHPCARTRAEALGQLAGMAGWRQAPVALEQAVRATPTGARLWDLYEQRGLAGADSHRAMTA